MSETYPKSWVYEDSHVVLLTEKKPVKIWLEKLEDMENGALIQAKNLANLPFLFKHVAIMPDTHQGYGMPIGGVIATDNVIIPNAVGVDIGCGMISAQTNLHIDDLNDDMILNIIDDIHKRVPVGFKHHKRPQKLTKMPKNVGFVGKNSICAKEYSPARTQIGTLGGGNHFIEIQKDDDSNIYIMIHSGSRNIGFKVANYYNKVAVALNEKWHTQIPKNHQLAFLPVDSEEGQMYIKEMRYCVAFAKANRQFMLDRVMDSFNKHIKTVKYNELNIAHNYAEIEHHFNRNVWVHRKGATKAYKDQLGIIPGSMGTSSFIIKGLGNQQSFKSCSHGAGRLMSRTEAKKVLDLDTERKLLTDVIHNMHSQNKLDEAPSAYKDIDVVMKNQKDLVEIQTKLTPIAVIKG